MPFARSIDEIVDALTVIIEQARGEHSRLGYFPALYRRVTRAVRDGIAQGRVQDGARMERLDVVFANRYLAAYDGWRAGQAVSRCWALAFNAAGRTDRTIIQHLLLGMNAHINLDLAVAAAEVAPGPAIATLQGDFQEINQILNEQVDGVQDAIASVSPLMWMLDTVGGRHEERMVEFSMAKARDAAWMQAKFFCGIRDRGKGGGDWHRGYGDYRDWRGSSGSAGVSHASDDSYGGEKRSAGRSADYRRVAMIICRLLPVVWRLGLSAGRRVSARRAKGTRPVR